MLSLGSGWLPSGHKRPALIGPGGPEMPRYLDPKLPVEERIDDLLSRMTLKEKIGQLELTLCLRE